MGIFDFLRKLKKSAKSESSEKEKLAVSDIEAWTERKIKESKAKEEDVLVLIQKKIDSLGNELKEKTDAAKSFDINLKKAEDRIKSAVEDGRKKYLESVEDFMISLNSLKKESFEKVISDTGRIFSEFNRKSRMSYERATILIGKEMAEIRETIKAFSRDLINIFNENKDIVEFLRRLSFIKLKLINLEKIEKELQKIDKEIIFINNELIEKEDENRKILAEIDIVKKSPEYMEKQRSQEKIRLLKNELGKDISDLRQLIDFKTLANFYHIFEDKIKIVKAHRDDFHANFQKDNGKTILDLLETSKLSNKAISDKLSQIHRKKEEILKIETELENEKNKDKANALHSASTKTIIEAGDLKNKKSREEKRIEKLKEDKEKIICELKENLEKLGAELT